MLRGMSAKAIVALLVLVMVAPGLAACGGRQAPAQTTPVDAQAATRISVAGVATLEIPEGAVEGSDGSVTLARWAGELPPEGAFPEVSRWESAVDVRVTGTTVVRPLDLRVVTEGPPWPGAVPVFAHLTAEGSWELRDAWSADDTTVTLRTADFSANILGWLNDAASSAARKAADALRAPLDSLADSLIGRTDPDPCPGAAPQWFRIDKRTTLVHACGVSNPTSEGSQRAELRLKSNRRFFTVTALPRGTDFVWVESGKSWLVEHSRRWIPSAKGAGEKLLPGQARLSAGFLPADGARTDRVTVFTDHWTAAVSLGVGVVTTLGGEGKGSLAAGILMTLECGSEVPDDLKDASGWWGLYTCLIRAGLGELHDPRKAGAAAENLIGGVPAVEVKSAAQELDAVSGGLQALGTAVKAVGLSFLVRDIFQQIPDAFSQMGGDRTGDVVLDFSPVVTASQGPRELRYVNPRFRFAVDIPSGFRLEEPGPANGDGAGLSDGRARIGVWGENNAMGYTADSALKAALRSRERQGTVTYRRLDDGYAISGIDGDGLVYYQRTWVGQGSMNALHWTYPEAEAARYNDLVEMTVNSFTPGDLSTSH